MDRGYIYVNKTNLINNIKYLKNISNKDICLVVKANAYGHGIEWAVRNAMQAGVSWFAVASIQEGIHARKISKNIRILLLSEPSKDEISSLWKNNLDITVYNENFINSLINYKKPFNVHLKVDTGMHRVGCEPVQFQTLVEKINTSELNLTGICTHFPTSETDTKHTKSAISIFKNLLKPLDIENLVIHVDNSASTFYNLDSTFNLSRVGIAAYGIYKSIPNIEHELKPTMAIKTRISNLQFRKKGDAVSYGKIFTLMRDSIIATAPIGYGDGYPWNSFPDGKVIVQNNFCNLVGRVTMDQIMFDVTDLSASIGDEVIILGSSNDDKLKITVSDIAKWNKTIEWEILTNMSLRLERYEIE